MKDSTSLYKVHIDDGEMYELLINNDTFDYEIMWWGREGSAWFGEGRGGSVINRIPYSNDGEEKAFRWMVSKVYLGAMYDDGLGHRNIVKIEKVS